MEHGWNMRFKARILVKHNIKKCRNAKHLLTRQRSFDSPPCMLRVRVQLSGLISPALCATHLMHAHLHVGILVSN